MDFADFIGMANARENKSSENFEFRSIKFVLFYQIPLEEPCKPQHRNFSIIMRQSDYFDQTSFVN